MRIMNILNTFFNLAISPSKGLEIVKRKENWILLLLLFLWANASRVTTGILIGTIPNFLNYGFPAYLGIVLVLWIFTVSTIHFFARIFGGKGGVLKFFYIWGFSNFPFVFYPLIGFWVYYLKGIGKIIPLSIFFIWLLSYKVTAIKLNYRVSTSKALFIFISPYLLIVILLIFIGLFFALSFFINI